MSKENPQMLCCHLAEASLKLSMAPLYQEEYAVQGLEMAAQRVPELQEEVVVPHEETYELVMVLTHGIKVALVGLMAIVTKSWVKLAAVRTILE